MKEVFKRYFPALMATVATNALSILIMKYNPKSIWTIISSSLIWIGGLILIISFIFELYKSQNKK